MVELPFPYCSSGGEFFARAGVSIAERIGADRLMFGSSCADRELLSDIARTLSSEEYRRLFSETEKRDPALGAAVIRSKVLGTLCPGYSREKCDNPNDILAAEYIRSAKIECVPVKRTDDALSATELRGMTAEEGAPFVPPASLEMMMNTPRADVSKLREILWMFFRMCGTDFENIAECRGGLGNRLRSAARQSGSAEEFFSLAANEKIYECAHSPCRDLCASRRDAGGYFVGTGIYESARRERTRKRNSRRRTALGENKCRHKTVVGAHVCVGAPPTRAIVPRGRALHIAFRKSSAVVVFHNADSVCDLKKR